LKYIFGEILYGGHIVNDFDRLLCNTYLDHFMRDEVLDEMEMFPYAEGEGVSFKAPVPMPFARYIAYIDENLSGDTPIAYGMHPNAEIDFRTTLSLQLFKTLNELQPREASADDGAATPQDIAANYLLDIVDRFGEIRFDMDDVECQLDEKGPFQNVFIQECDAVNTLLVEVSRSLKELNMGFAGELTMSDSMEMLQDDLFMGRVPASWASLAWPSKRGLPSWLIDLGRRIVQLQDWCANPSEIPRVTWISGLCNPTSFLTAIKQVSAQRTGDPLDKLIIFTDVTKRNPDDCDAPSRDGTYITGLYLEGARWDLNGAVLEKSAPKEMFCAMPVINCRAVNTDKAEATGVYHCPCYKTEMRGPTYVFSAQLKSKSPSARWIMAGVALLMDVGAA